MSEDEVAPRTTPESVDKFSIKQGELDCPLCLSLFFEPITLHCGHSFCRMCIGRALDAKRCCPECRQPTSVDPYTHSTNILISRLCETYNRQEYMQKRKEAKEQQRIKTTKRYIFLSETEQFPCVKTDLHIYEQRYRVMVNNALSRDKKFVIATVGPEQQIASDVACEVAIDKVRQLPDGRSLIRVTGTRVVKLSEVREDTLQFGLVCGNVRPLTDTRLARKMEQIEQGSKLAHDQTDELWELPSIDDIPEATEDADDQAELLLQKKKICMKRVAAFCSEIGVSLEDMQLIYGNIPSGISEFAYWVAGSLPQRYETNNSTAKIRVLQGRVLRSFDVNEHLDLATQICVECLNSAMMRAYYQKVVVGFVTTVAILYQYKNGLFSGWW